MAANPADFLPKRPKTGGRIVGTPNKTTVRVKEAILNAFEMVGGQQYLAMVALTDPKTFCTLLGRVLPAELTLPDGESIVYERILREVIDVTDQSSESIPATDSTRAIQGPLRRPG